MTAQTPSTISRRVSPRGPLYELVANTLLERIRAKTIQPGEAIPSERELCLEFNISRQTVRNAIASLSARGVLESRAGSGHFVRSGTGGARQSGRKRSTRQVGVICPPRMYLEEPSQLGALLGIKSRLSLEGYSVALSVSHKDEKAGFMPCYQHWLEDGDLSGYIGASVPAALQRCLLECGHPALSMGYVWENIELPSIAFDFKQLYFELLTHLASLGHQSIAAVLISPDSTFTRKVLDGIEVGRSNLGLAPEAIQIRRYADTAYDLVGAIRALMRSSKRPTALILQSNDYLDYVLRFFEMEGIRVPDDVHLTTVQITNPNIFNPRDRVAHYDFDYLNFGRMVAQAMLDLVEGKKSTAMHRNVLLGKIVDPATSPMPAHAMAG